MLTSKKITLESRTVVNEVEICKYIAIISEDNSEVTFFTQMLDKAACKEYRDIVRDDRAAFEDWAYELQDQHVKGAQTIGIFDEEIDDCK